MTSVKLNGIENILDIYVNDIQRGGRNGTSEMEVRFGTARGMKPISRIEYDDVMQRLMSYGFLVSESKYLLRINSEFIDPKTGTTKISNIRAELSGIGTISEYCKSNSIDNFYQDGKVKFMQKMPQKDGDQNVLPYDVPDFNFRASLSVEKDYTSSALAKSMVLGWKDAKKEFRYMHRHTLYHPDFPLSVDMSIVKQSKKKGRFTEKTYTFDEAGLNKTPARYEIEIEMNNNKVGPGSLYHTGQLLAIPLKKTVMVILSGIQGSNYPVSHSIQSNVLEEYMRILWKDKYVDNQRVYSKHFVGPSSVSLQVNNVSEINQDVNFPNIRNQYTVTEKADGDRKLLIITKLGLLYLIDTNMRVQFTGAKTKEPDLFETIIDGEHITRNKEGKFINLYAAFDIYYLKNRDIRTLGFIGKSSDDQLNYRLPLLNNALSQLKAFGITAPNHPSPMRFESKVFYSSNESQTIFQACNYLLQRVDDGIFEYETDGLIFTPMEMGVGSNKIGHTTPPKKITWDFSFKWKPPAYNTIDFLVTIQKGRDGRDEIKNIFQNGTDVINNIQITQYKTIILRVGFDETVHGYINPCLNVIEDNIPETGDKDNEEGYKPMQFFPTNPTDDQAGICYLLVQPSQGGNSDIFTENREIIEDNMIVEFRYNDSKEQGWRWEPLRVRYDKTSDLRSGGRNYGNAYHVANSNWHSIHNPVTREMITSGQNIPNDMVDDDVYYNRVSNATVTRSLRDFHNLYVKKKLILSASRRGDTLIDFAVGMGGDFSKWIMADLKFVFGIDISRDNIENRLKGACSRYLNYKKQFKRMPSALFVNGNSSVNIRDTSAMFTDKAKQITNAVFGKGPKDAVELGKGVYKHYGISESGFDISSIQFALHYMFENTTTLHNFLRNVSETTKLGGHFIGTCYDGMRMFNLMKSIPKDGNIELKDESVKMWEVTKRYERDTFLPNASSLGYAIDIYMESIGKTFREYLVNFEYLDRQMANYGFTLIGLEHAKRIGLPSGRGTFRDLFNLMREELKRNPSNNDYGLASNMTENEKTVSFLNNYFIYKKTHDVDAKAVTLNMIGTTTEHELNLKEESEKANDALEVILETQIKPKKLHRKLKLVNG
jgi:hypothetical protein